MKLRLKNNRCAGKLIVFEGTDGAGKTTLLTWTRDRLAREIGADKLLTIKQPTDLSRKTKLFQKMMYSENHDDIDYRAVQLLTMSDRMQHQYEVIEPALRQGKTVLCDRYVFTSAANMEARGYLHEKWFYDAAKFLLRPDVTFLAYAPPQTAIARIRARPEECDRYLDESLLHRVAARFRGMAAREKFVVLDTDGAPEKAFARIEETLRKKGIVR